MRTRQLGSGPPRERAEDVKTALIRAEATTNAENRLRDGNNETATTNAEMGGCIHEGYKEGGSSERF